MDSFTFTVPPRADKKKLQALIEAQLIYEQQQRSQAVLCPCLSNHWRAALALYSVGRLSFLRTRGRLSSPCGVPVVSQRSL